MDIEVYSLLATLILLCTVATIVLAFVTYVLFRFREHKKLKKQAGHGHGHAQAAAPEPAPAPAAIPEPVALIPANDPARLAEALARTGQRPALTPAMIPANDPVALREALARTGSHPAYSRTGSYPALPALPEPQEAISGFAAATREGEPVSATPVSASRYFKRYEPSE